MRTRKKNREVLSVRIDKDVRENFLQSCRMSGQDSAEVVETLILWFLTKENQDVCQDSQ